MMKKLKKVYRIFSQHPVLTTVLFIQALVIVYLNLFQLDKFVGYDCSAYRLEAIEMWKQKRLILSDWDYQTTLMWDAPTILAALFYGVFQNISFSWGLALVICVAILMVTITKLQQIFNLSLRSKLVSDIIILTPFMAAPDGDNNIEYFGVMFFSHGAYTVKICLLIAIWVTFWKVMHENSSLKLILLSTFVTALCLISGMSSGLYSIVFGIGPLVVYCIYRGIRKNKWRDMQGATTFIAASSCAILAGKIISAKLLGFDSRDSFAVWTSLDKFWENLQSILTGYFKFTGALPVVNGEVNVLTSYGIGFAFRLCLSLLILIGGYFTFARAIKRTDSESEIFISCLFATEVLIFVPIYTTYGTAIFCTRYLIPAFILLTILFAKWFDIQVCGTNSSWNSVLSGCLVVCTLFVNIYSYYYIYYSQLPNEMYAKIIESANSLSSPVVYVIGDTSDVVDCARNLRVLDTNRVYKAVLSNATGIIHWGDYTYFDENAEHTGITTIVTKEETFLLLPPYIQSTCKYVSTIPNTTINVYESSDNRFDFVAGITDNIQNIDYPYSPGICLQAGGNIDSNGDYITDGSSGYVTWGPYTTAVEGKYDFTLNYHVINVPDESNGIGFFDVAINANQIASVELDPQSTSVTISNIILDKSFEGGQLEYRVCENEGVILGVESFEIKSVEN